MNLLFLSVHLIGFILLRPQGTPHGDNVLSKLRIKAVISFFNMQVTNIEKLKRFTFNYRKLMKPRGEFRCNMRGLEMKLYFLSS